MTRSSRSDSPLSVVGRSWWRLAALLAVVAGGVLALRYTPVRALIERDTLIAWLEGARANPAAPFLFVLLLALLAALGAPISPVILAGGAAFGVWPGSLLNLLGAILGGVATFLLARALGYSTMAAWLGEPLRRLERLVARRGFWTLVRLRFLPLPYALVNVTCALCGVRLRPFVLSTALAFTPSMVVWCWLASGLVEAVGGERSQALRQAIIAFLLLLALSFLPPRLIAWRRGQRLRALRQHRALPRA